MYAKDIRWPCKKTNKTLNAENDINEMLTDISANYESILAEFEGETVLV